MSDEGVLTDPEKVSAVREWPTPHMPTGMCSFLASVRITLGL